MVYRNKKLCLSCQKYLPCLTINQYCCGCIKSNRTIQQRPCGYCQNQPLGEETKIDQREISQINYEDYKERLRQDKDLIWHPGQGYTKVDSWAICSKCQKPLEKAGHHGAVKQRYQTKFWELKTPYKVLCFDCLNNFKGKMPLTKKYTFHKYLKRYNY